MVADRLCLLTASEDRQLRLFELPAAAATAAAAEQRRARARGRRHLRLRVVPAHALDGGGELLLPVGEPRPPAPPVGRVHRRAARDYAAYDHLDEVTSAYCAAFEPTGAGSTRASSGRYASSTSRGRGAAARRARRARRRRAATASAGSSRASASRPTARALRRRLVRGHHRAVRGERAGVGDAARRPPRRRHAGELLGRRPPADGSAARRRHHRMGRAADGNGVGAAAARADANQRIGFHISADSRASCRRRATSRVPRAIRAQSGARNPAHSGAILGGTPTPPSPFRYDLAAPDAPPAVWLTYAGATNAAALHRLSSTSPSPSASANSRCRAASQRRRRRRQRRRPRGGGGGGGRGPQRVPSVAALGDRTAGGGRRRERGRRTSAEGVERGASAEEAGAPSTSAAGRRARRRAQRRPPLAARARRSGAAPKGRGEVEDGPSHVLSASVESVQKGVSEVGPASRAPAQQKRTKICSTRPSRVVPHRSTTSSTSLYSLFGWEG